METTTIIGFGMLIAFLMAFIVHLWKENGTIGTFGTTGNNWLMDTWMILIFVLRSERTIFIK